MSYPMNGGPSFINARSLNGNNLAQQQTRAPQTPEECRKYVQETLQRLRNMRRNTDYKRFGELLRWCHNQQICKWIPPKKDGTRHDYASFLQTYLLINGKEAQEYIHAAALCLKIEKWGANAQPTLRRTWKVPVDMEVMRTLMEIVNLMGSTELARDHYARSLWTGVMHVPRPRVRQSRGEIKQDYKINGEFVRAVHRQLEKSRQNARATAASALAGASNQPVPGANVSQTAISIARPKPIGSRAPHFQSGIAAPIAIRPMQNLVSVQRKLTERLGTETYEEVIKHVHEHVDDHISTTALCQRFPKLDMQLASRFINQVMLEKGKHPIPKQTPVRLGSHNKMVPMTEMNNLAVVGPITSLPLINDHPVIDDSMMLPDLEMDSPPGPSQPIIVPRPPAIHSPPPAPPAPRQVRDPITPPSAQRGPASSARSRLPAAKVVKARRRPIQATQRRPRGAVPAERWVPAPRQPASQARGPGRVPKKAERKQTPTGHNNKRRRSGSKSARDERPRKIMKRKKNESPRTQAKSLLQAQKNVRAAGKRTQTTRVDTASESDYETENDADGVSSDEGAISARARPKRPKRVAKAAWNQRCIEIVKKLSAMKGGDYFKELLHKAFPEWKSNKFLALYYKIIENPISFNMVLARLARAHYRRLDDYISDMETLFINAKTFNHPKDDCWKYAHSLSWKFKELMDNVVLKHGSERCNKKWLKYGLPGGFLSDDEEPTSHGFSLCDGPPPDESKLTKELFEN